MLMMMASQTLEECWWTLKLDNLPITRPTIKARIEFSVGNFPSLKLNLLSLDLEVGENWNVKNTLNDSDHLIVEGWKLSESGTNKNMRFKWNKNAQNDWWGQW